MKNRYRIVADNYLGYEAQIKFWWFPFVWFQMSNGGPCNTWHSEEAAEQFIRHKASYAPKKVNPYMPKEAP